MDRKLADLLSLEGKEKEEQQRNEQKSENRRRGGAISSKCKFWSVSLSRPEQSSPEPQNGTGLREDSFFFFSLEQTLVYLENIKSFSFLKRGLKRVITEKEFIFQGWKYRSHSEEKGSDYHATHAESLVTPKWVLELWFKEMSKNCSEEFVLQENYLSPLICWERNYRLRTLQGFSN